MKQGSDTRQAVINYPAGLPQLLKLSDLAAKLRGEIPSLRVEIDRLRKAGFRVSPDLAQALLHEAGE